ncbi:hypothetical protein GCM10010365_76200 [Streptomyces poonensis]|uniref:Uncharacterized protein n=1 Tax=Streptomyces poonensis TaxID=68255 RepID=A0A918QGS2_9ACTN|nr:hypothetical protein GCM10010365_76200 [Streptomyces poonensis]GLJ93539.1 hypothetical protein GCM10017589_61530 [Streptomyces poonensis]
MPSRDDLHTIDGDVYVSPRHLAGTTAIGDHGFASLRDLGWNLQNDDLGNAYLNAPDRRVRLGYLPEGEDDGLWRTARLGRLLQRLLSDGVRHRLHHRARRGVRAGARRIPRGPRFQEQGP